MAKRKKPRNLHDRAFKALFAPPDAALALLRAALPTELVDAIDPGSLEPGPTEIVNDELHEDERDLLFKATIRGGPVLFYLLEHQRTVDRFMAVRLLRYVLRVWDWWRAAHPRSATLPAVVPLVLHQGAKAWDGPRSLAELVDLPPDLLADLGPRVPAFDFALQDLGPASIRELAAFPGPPIVRVTLCFFRAVADPHQDPLAVLEAAQGAIQELLAQEGGRERFSVVLLYTVLARGELDVHTVAAEFERIAGPEAGEVVMSTAQELVQQGRRELLEALLREQFGKLSAATRERLEAASPEELETWGKRILKAKRLEDVFDPRRRSGSGRSRKK